jgi:S-methylmethionine-dependent homocysteine/selenocysteine methylase
MAAIDSQGHGLLLDALVWRAHPDYVAALGYAPSDLVRLNELAVARTKAAVHEWREQERRTADDFPVLIAADIGPRGDGYRVDDAPAVEDAIKYHRAQLDALASTDVDIVCAWTMTNVNEAIGITRAATELELPIIVSATVETDGRLPDGTTMAEFVYRVDEATHASPIFYMVNCAHPTHLADALATAREEDWLSRFKGFRANCSTKSHEELDNSTELDRGNPKQLAVELAAMQQAYDLKVLGGCCGTDVEHIAEIARAAA